MSRLYANRFAAANGRPRAQRKTPAQLELLGKVFRKTGARPYTGEQLAAAFLTGLTMEQVRNWFENERKKYLKNDEYGALDFWDQNPEQTPNESRLMILHFNKGPEAYARSLVFGERDVRTGDVLGEWDVGLGPRRCGCYAEDMSLIGRVSLVKAWNAWEGARAGQEVNVGEQQHEEVIHE